MGATTRSHDETNLARLVRRLEKSAEDPSVVQPTDEDYDAWIRAQGMIQKVKYAKKLLRNVELEYSAESEVEPKKVASFDRTRSTLERLQSVFQRISEDHSPELAPKYEPILPRIPKPTPQLNLDESNGEEPQSNAPEPPESALLPSETTGSGSWADSISSPLPSSTTEVPTTDISSNLNASSSSTALPTRPAFLQNSQQIQQELSDQLAQMASQLKRNTERFAQALEDDKAVMEGTEEKLEGNMGMMTKEKGRLKDHSSKSTGTTFMTLLIVLVVFFAFMMMVALIRLTRF